MDLKDLQARARIAARIERQRGRRAVGTPAFGGMLAGSFVGIFIIPMVFEGMRTRKKAPSLNHKA